MQGRRARGQLEVFVCGSLRDLVPDDHILARVDRVLDLGWLHAEVSGLYARDGRPGIDPEAAVRLKDLARLCLSKGRVNKAVVIGNDYPALLRARRRRERWSEEDRQLYRRHRWRSEGFHGEAKAWHRLARAVRRGLQNMRIQAFLTAAAINLKRLAAAIALLFAQMLAALALQPTRNGRAGGPPHLAA